VPRRGTWASNEVAVQYLAHQVRWNDAQIIKGGASPCGVGHCLVSVAADVEPAMDLAGLADAAENERRYYATTATGIPGNSEVCITVRIPLGTLGIAPLPTLSCRLSARGWWDHERGQHGCGSPWPLSRQEAAVKRSPDARCRIWIADPTAHGRGQRSRLLEPEHLRLALVSAPHRCVRARHDVDLGQRGGRWGFRVFQNLHEPACAIHPDALTTLDPCRR
jgi:hypothetical protein